MPNITYSTDISGVDWAKLKQRLQEDDFDNGRTPEQYRTSFENSFLVVLAYAEDEIIGKARVLSDGVCNAYIIDVWTYTPYRKQGIATEMMRLALAHLHGQHVCLFTDDAVEFYRKLGFAEEEVGMSMVKGIWLQNDPRAAE